MKPSVDELAEITNEVLDKILPHTLKTNVGRHLDIGCGNGYLTDYLADKVPKASFIGYNPNINAVRAARKKSIAGNSDFTTNKEVFNEEFSSLSLIFTLNKKRNQNLLKKAYNSASRDSQIVIVDYDMKALPKSKLSQKVQSSNNENPENLEPENLSNIYTTNRLEDYVRMAKNIGFKTKEKEKIYDDKFIYVGEKTQ